MRLRLIAAALALGLPAFAAHADDLVAVKRLSMELARDIAQGAVEACRKEGYQVSAVVVDRTGIVQVLMRDVLASRFTLEIAQKKANAVILSAVSTKEFLSNRAEIINSMNQLSDVLVLEGGLPIRAAGSLVGAIGVSGALGGDTDALCAAKGLEQVAERLEFAE